MSFVLISPSTALLVKGRLPFGACCGNPSPSLLLFLLVLVLLLFFLPPLLALHAQHSTPQQSKMDSADAIVTLIVSIRIYAPMVP